MFIVREYDLVLIDVEGEDGLKFTPTKHRHKEPAAAAPAGPPKP